MTEPKTVGFIDIGTNSVHLLVVRFYDGTLGTEIARDREVLRIGRSLYSEGIIDEDAINKCGIIVKKFTAYAKKHGASEVIAYATCAAREAENSDELIDAIKTEGLEVRIIPGEEEARLISLGVLGENGPREKTLLIDIGGGSTEISIRKGRETLFIDSLPLGAVRFAYGFPYDCKKGLTYEEYSSYQHEVDLCAYRAMRRIKEIGFDRAVGSSGTFETLCDLCPSKERKGTLALSALSERMESMMPMDIAERSKIPKLSEARADIIVAGGAIAEELMKGLGINEIEISHFGLKEGMMVDYRVNHGLCDIDVRESAIAELGFKCGYDRAHAMTVRRCARKIALRLNELGVCSLDAHMIQMLEYASQLHDIGEVFGYGKHHVMSHDILMNSSLVGFDIGEIQTMATMVRYHHKKMPSADDSAFRRLDERTSLALRQCILILRMADAMDRHRMQLETDFTVEAVKGNTIKFTLISEQDVSMERWKLEESATDFKILFDRKLSVA